MQYIKRTLETEILQAAQSYPVIMLCGQRQVGKSTMLYHIKEAERTYVTLDDINARHLAETDPALFFETYNAPLIIDEFQRVPELTLELKKLIDLKTLQGQDCAGDYWLTGSQKFSVLKNVADSLAGRIAIFEMSTLSLAELEERNNGFFCPEIDVLRKRLLNTPKKTVQEVYQRIFQGGMPKLTQANVEREQYYASYVDTYLQKDIIDFARIGKLREFSNFLIYMAAHTSQELKFSEIAKSLGISAVTAKEWVSILERSGIIYILYPYFNNISKRLIKTPKAYFLDTGLAAYLCRWPSAETLANGAMDGAFFESFVVSEIVKSFYNAGKRPDLYYFEMLIKKELTYLCLVAISAIRLKLRKINFLKMQRKILVCLKSYP